MNYKIKKVTNKNINCLTLCKKLDDYLNEFVAEQRAPNASCLRSLNRFPNVYILYIDSTVAGYLASSDINNGIIEIDQIYVSDDFRNHGIATKLLENLEQIAKSLGANMLILDTYERLPNAIKLYKKLGFQIVPQFEHLKDSPYSICMQKNLI